MYGTMQSSMYVSLEAPCPDIQATRDIARRYASQAAQLSPELGLSGYLARAPFLSSPTTVNTTPYAMGSAPVAERFGVKLGDIGLTVDNARTALTNSHRLPEHVRIPSSIQPNQSYTLH